MTWPARSAVVRPRLVRDNPERFYKLLQDEAAGVRSAAATAIGQTGQHGSGAIPKLASLLDDPDPAVKKSAAQALSTITNSIELVKGRKAQPIGVPRNQ